MSDLVNGDCTWYPVLEYCDGVALNANNAIRLGCPCLDFVILFRRDGDCGEYYKACGARLSKNILTLGVKRDEVVRVRVNHSRALSRLQFAHTYVYFS